MKTTILLVILFICAQLAAQDSTIYKQYRAETEKCSNYLLQLEKQYKEIKQHGSNDANVIETDIKTMQKYYIIVKGEMDTINKMSPVYSDYDRDARKGLYYMFDLCVTFYNSAMNQLQSNYNNFVRNEQNKQLTDYIKQIASDYMPIINILLQNYK
jgi:hypothetical protein